MTSQVLRTLEADVRRAAGLLQQARGKWAEASASKFPLQSRNSQPGVNGVIQPLLFPECVARVPVSLWGSGG